MSKKSLKIQHQSALVFSSIYPDLADRQVRKEICALVKEANETENPVNYLTEAVWQTAFEGVCTAVEKNLIPTSARVYLVAAEVAAHLGCLYLKVAESRAVKIQLIHLKGADWQCRSPGGCVC